MACSTMVFVAASTSAAIQHLRSKQLRAGAAGSTLPPLPCLHDAGWVMGARAAAPRPTPGPCSSLGLRQPAGMPRSVLHSAPAAGPGACASARGECLGLLFRKRAAEGAGCLPGSPTPRRIPLLHPSNLMRPSPHNALAGKRTVSARVSLGPCRRRPGRGCAVCRVGRCGG